jgi:hypothetical protein
MSNLKRRVERIERALQAAPSAGRDRRSCPTCQRVDALRARFGIGLPIGEGWQPPCPGHPERTPEEAKAAADAALERLRAKVLGNR